MSIIFIDDSRLFAKTVEVPSELSQSDVAGLCAFESESLPIYNGEKSVCSFLRTKESVVIYVGSRSRAFVGYSDEEIFSARLVLPISSVLIALGVDGLFALETSESVTILQIENGSLKNIASCPLTDNYEQVLNNAIALSGIDEPKSIKPIKLASAKVSGRKLIVSFNILDLQGNIEQTFLERIALSKLANADLRSAEQIKALQSFRIRNFVQRILSVSAVIILLLLFVWQGALFLKKSEIADLERRLEEILPTAKKVEAQSLEIAKLSKFLGDRIRPIETLALINTMRPDSVMFERIEQSSSNVIQIVGTSDSITNVKTFVDAINASEKFSAQMDSDSSRGNTRFTISISGGSK